MVKKMKNKSIWISDIENEMCAKLDHDLDIDVLIIGGGITGISIAYQLINSKLNVCLVEKEQIGAGITSKTTGKISYLQENIYSKIKKYRGLDVAKRYLDSQIYASNMIKDIVTKNNIDCNFNKTDSYIINNNSFKYEEEKNILKTLGINIKETTKLPNEEEVNSAFYVDDTYVFHPLKYIYALKDKCLNGNINIYEKTKIISINKENNYYICKTGNNSIKCKYVVLALHYPYFMIPFWMPLKTYIEESYIKATKINNNLNYSSITIDKPINSTRYHTINNETYEIILSNTHNSCIKNNNKNNFRELLALNHNKPDYIWSNNDLITFDSIPFIGAIDTSNTLLIATGYNTWGMTNSTIASKIIADIILKKDNQYIDIFDPKRKINVGKILNFPLIIGSSAYSFIKSKLIKQKTWYSSNVKFEKRDGRNIAIYTDENGTEHIVYNLCPHMKCSLIFNEIEHTWDCPCHGSRFDIDGKSITGPSNYDITYKKESD